MWCPHRGALTLVTISHNNNNKPKRKETNMANAMEKMNLRDPMDINGKAKNPWETKILEPGAPPSTSAETATNKGGQEYGPGPAKKDLGGKNTGS